MRIHILRPGTYTDVKGTTVSFAAADLAATAAAYDPAVHEAPLVVGHPSLTAPAYGWTKTVEAAPDGLWVEADQVNPEFAQLVRDGAFKKVSASFFGPTAAGNPKPGTWYLRHVGFLGAAAPAVAGLAPVQFASPPAEVVTVEFAAASIAHTQEVTVTTKTAEQLQQELEQLRAQNIAFAAQAKAHQLAADKSFVDGLVQGAKLPAGLADQVVAFMGCLEGVQTVEFAAAGGQTVKATPRDRFKEILASLPKLVSTAVLPADAADPAGSAVSFASPPGWQVDPERLALHNRAVAFQAAHPGTSYDAALAAISR